jgi:hypothetical protein
MEAVHLGWAKLFTSGGSESCPPGEFDELESPPDGGTLGPQAKANGLPSSNEPHSMTAVTPSMRVVRIEASRSIPPGRSPATWRTVGSALTRHNGSAVEVG